MINGQSASPMEHYKRQLAAGRFSIQRCSDCGTRFSYPRVVCPRCASVSLEWQEPSGEGTIYATTVVRRPDKAGGPYNVVLVDLDEGVRLMSTVVDTVSGEASIGQRVKLEIAAIDGEPAPVFRVLPQSGSAR